MSNFMSCPIGDSPIRYLLERYICKSNAVYIRIDSDETAACNKRAIENLKLKVIRINSSHWHSALYKIRRKWAGVIANG